MHKRFVKLCPTFTSPSLPHLQLLLRKELALGIEGRLFFLSFFCWSHPQHLLFQGKLFVHSERGFPVQDIKECKLSDCRPPLPQTPSRWNQGDVRHTATQQTVCIPTWNLQTVLQVDSNLCFHLHKWQTWFPHLITEAAEAEGQRREQTV